MPGAFGNNTIGLEARATEKTMPEMIIQTYTGLMVDVANLKPDQVRLVDIAWALSNLCRFNGHTRGFYSVAQHSVEVSLRVEHPGSVGNLGTDRSRLRAQKWALIHDAAEAYLGDVPSPIKKQIASFWQWEDGVMKAISNALGLGEYQPTEIEKVVRAADERMLITEKRDVLRHPDLEWTDAKGEAFEEPIGELWGPERSYGEFMRGWCSLTQADVYVGEPELATVSESRIPSPGCRSADA